MESAPDIDFRVSLRNSRNTSEVVAFVATPDLIETRNVNYKTVDPVHAPGQIFAYASTSSRNFNISSVKLISRTSKEAAHNLKMLWLLRSWTMPRFGKSDLTDSQRLDREFIDSTSNAADQISVFGLDVGTENRGAPPAVLLLSAYSSGTTATGSHKYAQHINRVPVVIQNLSIPYPADVDYIPAEGSGVPMPTIMTLDMTLAETHSPNEYENFSLDAFKNGLLGGF